MGGRKGETMGGVVLQTRYQVTADLIFNTGLPLDMSRLCHVVCYEKRLALETDLLKQKCALHYRVVSYYDSFQHAT
jgi:hypothetical protein